jgi:hypothetical protein
MAQPLSSSTIGQGSTGAAACRPPLPALRPPSPQGDQPTRRPLSIPSIKPHHPSVPLPKTGAIARAFNPHCRHRPPPSRPVASCLHPIKWHAHLILHSFVQQIFAPLAPIASPSHKSSPPLLKFPTGLNLPRRHLDRPTESFTGLPSTSSCCQDGLSVTGAAKG